MDRDEVLHTVEVDANKIVCRTCVHRNHGQRYPHFTKAHCGIYRKGRGKPSSILWDGGGCKYYKRDKEA